MKNYKGLEKKELEQILYTPGNLPNKNQDYIKKAMDSKEFYVGRMKKDGNDAATGVLERKYLAPGEKGPLYMWHRIADAVSSVENTPEKQEKSYYDFMDALDDFKLIPGGRILHGAGRKDISTTLNNCYVVGIKEDSIDAIYDTVKDEAMTYKKGGGCGHNLSILRPENERIGETGSTSCGPTGFMELYSVNTNTIGQHGRRGALMMNISDWHPDVEKFIQIKNDVAESINVIKDLAKKYPNEKQGLKILAEQIEKKRAVQYANVSVLLGNDFMNAVIEDKEYNLVFPDIESYQENNNLKKFYNDNWDGDIERWKIKVKEAKKAGAIPEDTSILKIHKKIKAKKVWNEMIDNAHESAEPGLLFWDIMRAFHNLEYASPLLSTNPCAEEPLPRGGCCNLASINLERMVQDDGTLDEDLFKTTTKRGIRFLDNVIDYNLDRHALKEQKENAINDRRIGLGITGLGDMLLKMGIKYDSDEGIEKVGEVMEIFQNTAYQESINLAKEKGSFPNYNWEGLNKSKYIQNLPDEIKEQIQKTGLRNGTLTTAAPVGSGGIMAETTSGMEPIFDLGYERIIKNHKTGKDDLFTVYHPLIEKMFKDKENLPKQVITAHDIDPLMRIKMQGTVQKYIDASISSTINLPADVKKETVSDIYLEAYKKGLKGVTVYRDGSRNAPLKRLNLENVVEEDIPDFYYNELLMKKLKRSRPGYVAGAMVKIKTPHSLNAFVGLNWEMNEKGKPIKPYESWVNLGKAGEDLKAMAEGIARVGSLALKAGVPYELITEQLIGIGGSSQDGFGKNKVKSLSDAIGKGIKKSAEQLLSMYKKGSGEEGEEENKEEEPIQTGNLCHCGLTLRMENGCEVCPVHGSDKC